MQSFMAYTEDFLKEGAFTKNTLSALSASSQLGDAFRILISFLLHRHLYYYVIML